MAFLSMQGVTLNLGGKPLLDAADFSVETGERLCLIGRNGAGKSSLLALLGGQMEPNSGIIIRPGTQIGQMPQDVPEDWSGSVFSLVAEALGEEGKALAAAHAKTGQDAAKAHSADTTETASGSSENLAGHEPELYLASDWERYGEVLAVINHLELDPDAEFATAVGSELLFESGYILAEHELGAGQRGADRSENFILDAVAPGEKHT